jgi:hypothetical protein
MLRNGKIDAEAYKKAMETTLQFRRGKFRFSLSTNMVKIKRLMDSPVIQEALVEAGVENYMTEGLSIQTTLDPELQRSAEYRVYRNLAELDIVLRGYHPPKADRMDLVPHFVPGSFVAGRVDSVVSQKGKPHKLYVRFGTAKATVGADALKEFFTAVNRHAPDSLRISSLPPPLEQQPQPTHRLSL